MDAMTRILAECRAHKRIHINLAEQTVLDQNNIEFARFDIEERRKMELLNGMDEIDTTLRSSGDIRAFEESRRLVRPWIEDAVQGWRSKQSRNATLGREINSGGLLEPVVLDW